MGLLSAIHFVNVLSMSMVEMLHSLSNYLDPSFRFTAMKKSFDLSFLGTTSRALLSMHDSVALNLSGPSVVVKLKSDDL